MFFLYFFPFISYFENLNLTTHIISNEIHRQGSIHNYITYFITYIILLLYKLYPTLYVITLYIKSYIIYYIVLIEYIIQYIIHYTLYMLLYRPRRHLHFDVWHLQIHRYIWVLVNITSVLMLEWYIIHALYMP